MANKFEIDYRWAALFLSLMVTFLLRQQPIALTVHVILVGCLTVAYFLFLPRHLNGVETRFRHQFMTHLDKKTYEQASRLVEDQWKLRTLGRRYVIENARGLLRMIQGDFDSAYQYFKHARQHAPYGERAAIDLNLVNTEMAMGESEAAIDRCRDILAVRPNSPLIQEKLASLLLEQVDS